MIVLLADLIFSHQSERDELPTATEWVILIWVSSMFKHIEKLSLAQRE